MESPTSSPAQISLLTFHSFLRLPLELKLKIYRLIANKPRNVKIHRKFLNLLQPIPTGQTPPLIYLICHDPVPVVLHLCHASRMEAKNVYFPSFQTGSAERYVWVNFDVDTIELTNWALTMVKSQDRERMQDVVIEVKGAFEDLAYYGGSFSLMQNLARLDTLSEVRLINWDGDLPKIQKWFDGWFGDREGWVRPEVRIIEVATGMVMDNSNLEVWDVAFDRERREISESDQ